MQALLLATAETLKLMPLTERIPSPLIPIMNRPIMVYNLELLGRLGFKRILVSVHSLAGNIERFFGDGGKWGLSLEYVLQRDALGSAGSLWWAKGLLQESFIVIPADIIADFEVAGAIHEHTTRQELMTVVVQPGHPKRSRALLVDSGGYIQAMGNSSASTRSCTDTGIYLFNPCILDKIPPRLPFDIHLHLIPKLLAQRIPVFTCPLPGYWNPLDNFQNYAEAQHVFLLKALKGETRSDERITYRYHSLEGRQIAHGIWAGRNVKIHPSATLVPPNSIGHNSWIGRDVELGPGAVIGSNVVIDQGATIQESIILDGTYVGKLVHLENRLVNQGQLVNLGTDELVRVTDPILLGKAGPQFVAAGFKRSMDIFLSILFLLISLPLTLILGILLLLYTGRVFKRVPCLSTRSSRRNSHSGLIITFDLLQFNTSRADERPVWIGRWMEKWEGQRLPELWNVLNGDLAMVGLKPVLTEAESQIRAARQLDQDEVPAGFTGLWYVQTSDSSLLGPFEESLIADAYYLATRSWAQDWKILWRTPNTWFRKVQSKAVSQFRTA